MTLDELKEFIDQEDRRLRSHYGNPPREKRILARTVKLSEEVGELCNEVLMAASLQRGDKLIKKNDDNLKEEVADVLITALLLSKSLDVDFREALKKKIQKIQKRNYK